MWLVEIMSRDVVTSTCCLSVGIISELIDLWAYFSRHAFAKHSIGIS